MVAYQRQWVRWLIASLLVLGSIVLVYEFASLRKEIRYAVHATKVDEMRAALIEIWVANQLYHSPNAMQKLIGSNPVRLLKAPIEDYLGEFKNAPSNIENAWFFNLNTQCLVYVFKREEQVAYRLAHTNGMHVGARGMIGGLDLVKDSDCLK